MSAPFPPQDCNSMADVRIAIDALDRQLVSLLAERAGFIDRAMQLKQDNGWPARIPDRVEQVVQNVKAEAQAQHLDAQLTERLWRQLIDWSIDREEAGLAKTSAGK